MTEYHEQARQMAEELISVVRRYGMEYDLDVSSVLGILELVKYDVLQSALGDLDVDEEEEEE
jgi:hypothetical protein